MDSLTPVDCSDIARKVVVVYSLPRLMPTDIAFCGISIASQLGIHFIKRHGVFFGQSLTAGMKRAADKGAEYVLTVDYDTPHTAEDVLYLYALMKLHPEAGAICPLQMKRESTELLVSIRNPDGSLSKTIKGEHFRPELARVTAAHFGLTFIRVASLLKVAKPWFHSVPDENGEWGANHVDEDINFWHRFEAAGQSLFVATRCVVGHMQWMVVTPGKQFEPVYQTVDDWESNGIPLESRRK